MTVVFVFHLNNMSLVMRKPAFCICENKDADQLRSKCAADQRLCFRYIDSTIPLLSKSEITSLMASFGRKPRRPVFSQRGSYLTQVQCMVDTQKLFFLNQNTFKLGFKTTLRSTMFLSNITDCGGGGGERALLLATGCLHRAGLLAGICRTKVKVPATL